MELPCDKRDIKRPSNGREDKVQLKEKHRKMKLLDRIVAKPGYITLALGVAIGIGSAAYFFKTDAVPKAIAQNEMPVRPIAGMTAENMSALRQLDASFANLAAYIEPSVVHIRTEGSRSTDVFGNRMGVMGGEGSGVIFRPDGWIVTNDHVVGGFDKVTVVLNDGREFPGKVIRSGDRTIDVSVVKIEATGLPSAKFGDSRKVKPGQFAIAVGSPFGLENSVTVGHISALGRQRVVGDALMGSYRAYNDFIQTDAPLNQGNSGGPLVNIEGEVIGINTAIFSGTGGSVGIGFAIPSNFARAAAENMIEKGKLVRGYLGIGPENLKGYQAKQLGISEGAYVAELPNDGPAAMAGIKQGDVITQIGSVKITSQQDLRAAMLRYSPGETVRVEFWRDKATKSVNVKVGKAPAETALNDQQPKRRQIDPESMIPDLKGIDPFFGFKIPDGSKDVPPIREGKAKLGVTVKDLDADLRKQYNIPASVKGAVVTSVAPDSVAAGLDLRPGDVIQRIGLTTINTADDLTKAMESVKWGDTRQIKVSRFGPGTQTSLDVPVTFR